MTLMIGGIIITVVMIAASCQKDPVEADPPSDDVELPIVFSVSPTRQVTFSPGNLQYHAYSNTWRFAPHQYDYIGTHIPDEYWGDYGWTDDGSDNRDISPTYDGWIDLFGWGTSGWNSGATCYQPWSISTTDSDYGPGDTNDLTGAYSEADWAWHNSILNGGYIIHRWRTLTYEEWNYLLFERPNFLEKYGLGSIIGINGLIILPDNWTLPVGCTFKPYSARHNVDLPDNNYSLEQWKLMESAGAVFLPAAGYRLRGTEVLKVGVTGKYWTSTHWGWSGACSMGFRKDVKDIYTSGGDDRSHGYSVRPVRDIN